MAYVTYKNRSSEDYRFTVKSLDDPAIADLKAILVRRNGYITRARKLYGPTSYYGSKNTQGLRIRPRGSRKTNGVGFNGYCYYDTPIENATHFDVYIRDYK
jgi:hypothetical protein